MEKIFQGDIDDLKREQEERIIVILKTVKCFNVAVIDGLVVSYGWTG